MPTKLRRLKKEALESCEYRDHVMGKWHSVPPYYYEYVQACECDECGKQVVVHVYPAPNGIEIGGEAVALGCED